MLQEKLAKIDKVRENVSLNTAHKYGYIHYSISNKGNVLWNSDNLQLAPHSPILATLACFLMAPPPFPHGGIYYLNLVFILHFVILCTCMHP